MRLAVVSFIVLSVAGVAQAADRTLSIEAELMGPKDRSLGKTQVLVAARGTDRGRGVFGDLTLIVDVDVGPTFDRDCNLVTVTGRLEEAVPEGKPKRRDLKRTSVQACGPKTQATLAAGTNSVVITVRPAS